MAMYKHRNVKTGIIVIHDSEGIGHELKPGEEVIIDRKAEGNGVVVVEQIGTDEKSKEEKPRRGRGRPKEVKPEVEPDGNNLP